MKIIKSLEDLGIFLQGVSKTIENEVKEKTGRFLGILLCTLGVTLSKIY